MTQQRISAYEKGKREPDIETLKQFAEYFACTVDFLLGKSEYRNDEDYIKKNLKKTDKFLNTEFQYAYHKEMEGLTDEEISDALRFYKEMKKKIEEK